ncbi:MAG: pyridine nucleotide-disulfide oxidoreductase, partial [Gammaproteobacteria bacterium]
GGAAGLVAAYTGALLRARVALVEKDRMGGDCLHTGCVPSKALIRSARAARELGRAGELLGRPAAPGCDFAAVMERVQRAVHAVEPHDSAERYTALGVACIQGTARLRSPREVEVGGRVLRTRGVVLATGARPAIPDLPGLERVPFLTSDTVWGLRRAPERLLVLGGGPIGCELAQAFARLGVPVTLVQRRERLLPREDPEVSALLARRLAAEGVALRLGHRPLAVEPEGAGGRLRCLADGKERELPFSHLLLALGRRPVTEGLGLEALGVALRPDGTVATDRYLATSVPGVYACGDLTGPYQFTHAAGQQGWHAALNALLRPFWRVAADLSVLPRVTFTDPEVARVGVNEQEARAQGLAFEVVRLPLEELDRALVEDEPEGFVKLLVRPGSDRLLGATLVGAHAGEMLAELTLAMRHRLGLSAVLRTIHPYPTWSEAVRLAAGRWRRARTRPGLLRLLETFHRWRR